jgi:tetratricopeptide (TPR) repeat protein
MARSTPVVRDGTLFYQRDGQDCQVSVDSPAWYEWLSANRTFTFRSAESSFTARRERAGNKRGGWYWKAYVRREKRLRHAYLGKTESLTLERLRSVANTLAQSPAPVQSDDLLDESEAARRAHASYNLSLVEQAELRGERQVEWFNRLEQEYDNICAALNWLQENNSVEDILRLCAALHLFWVVRDRCNEGLQWVERALASSEHVSLTLRAHACYAAGALAYCQGQHQRGRELWEESLVMYQELNDPIGIVNVLNKLGQASVKNAPSEAHTLYKMSLKLAQQCEYGYGVLDATMSLADEALALADVARARSLYTEVLELSTMLRDKRSIAYSLGGLGQVHAQEGNYAEAHALLEESLRHLTEIGDYAGITFLSIIATAVSIAMSNII